VDARRIGAAQRGGKIDQLATGIFSGGGSCGTKPIAPSTAVRSWRGSRPSMVTRPSWVYSPSRQRIRVVLPAPLEPISATRSDSPMSG
jgi:hypothetical protein